MRLKRHRFKAMGSPCELHLYGDSIDQIEEAAELAVSEVARLENKYSRYKDDSVTAYINCTAGDPAGVEVDDETAALLDYAAVAYERSGGLFDITSGILRQVWDFKAGRVPSQKELDSVRTRIGWGQVSWKRPNLVLPRIGMELDFGGYVKEYTADRAAELCRKSGIKYGLVDLGGDLRVIGPHPDGKPWIVGIRHPRLPQAAMATVGLSAGGLASSGDYERFIIIDGKRYGHILNPKTGWPVSGLAAVSVIAPDCLIAGTASTIAILKGTRQGQRWLDKLGLPNIRMDQKGQISGNLEGLRKRLGCEYVQADTGVGLCEM